MTNAVKFVDGSDDTIEGLILPFGGPMGGKDLTGTYFTKDTDFAMDWFPDGGRPGLYRHGFDPALKTSVIGREIGGRDDERGHWLTAQLDKSHAYWGEVKALVDAGKLFLSSGSIDHLAQTSTKSGEITKWPWVEWSLVPNPANPDQPAVREYLVPEAEAVAHLAIVDRTLPAVKDYSSSAWEAAQGAMALNTVLQLMTCETDEPDQLALLQAACDNLTAWITAERAEIGVEEDATEALVAAMSRDRTPPVAGELAAPTAPVLTVSVGSGAAKASEDELATMRIRLAAEAVAAAKSYLG